MTQSETLRHQVATPFPLGFHGLLSTPSQARLPRLI